MDHAVKAMSARGPFSRLLARRRFESAELEELYARYACKLQRTSVGSALALWALLAAALAAVDVTRGWRRAPQVILNKILTFQVPIYIWKSGVNNTLHLKHIKPLNLISISD